MTTALLPLLLATEIAYGTACGLLGTKPGAPLWLRWPVPIWNFIRHGRPPKPRPNYARIARLERELGLTGSPPPELSPFEQGMLEALQERSERTQT